MAAVPEYTCFKVLLIFQIYVYFVFNLSTVTEFAFVLYVNESEIPVIVSVTGETFFGFAKEFSSSGFPQRIVAFAEVSSAGAFLRLMSCPLAFLPLHPHESLCLHYQSKILFCLKSLMIYVLAFPKCSPLPLLFCR